MISVETAVPTILSGPLAPCGNFSGTFLDLLLLLNPPPPEYLLLPPRSAQPAALARITPRAFRATGSTCLLVESKFDWEPNSRTGASPEYLLLPPRSAQLASLARITPRAFRATGSTCLLFEAKLDWEVNGRTLFREPLN